MPAKTSAKKTPPKKAAAAKKPHARRAARAKNGKSRSSPPGPDFQTQLVEREELLRAAQGKIAQLESSVEEARKSAGEELQQKLGALEAELHQTQDRLVASGKDLSMRNVALEAAAAEAKSLRETLKSARPSEPGKMHCPKCAGHMAEAHVEGVHPYRCETCKGLFFENGAIDEVLRVRDQQREAGGGNKGFWSGIFRGGK